MGSAMEMEKGFSSVTTEADAAAPPTNRRRNWWLLCLNCVLAAAGTIGGPLLLRLYYVHGGGRKWVSSWLQTAGFPLLLPPLSALYLRRRRWSSEPFAADPRLLLWSAAVGLLVGVDNFLYALGLSYLPVSTSSLLLSTQLAFTALFALLLVRQRFTPYSINAVVLMVLGAALLGLRKSGDRPPGVSDSHYVLGFAATLAAAALLGLILPASELAYARAAARATPSASAALQFQLGVVLSATIFCTIGMLINKDFAAIAREAASFDLGAAKYYLVLVATAVVFQMMLVGILGVVFCSSSLFAGVLSATLLPMTEVAGAVVYRESFSAEKGFALFLCLWGFCSYFYGSHRSNKKQRAQSQSPQN